MRLSWKQFMGQVSIPEGKRGGHEVRHIDRASGHQENLASMRTVITAGHRMQTVTFPVPTRWHELSYEEGVWMTDRPIEQMQTRAIIKGMAGTVLVGGLGLGLVVNLLAKNPRIKYIAVVETSKEVIELVAPYLQDPRKVVQVIHEDLFHYLARMRKANWTNIFNWAFYDIWQSDGEMTFFSTVVPLRQAAVGLVPDHHVVCWNEDVMRGQLCMSLHSRYQTCRLPKEDFERLHFFSLDQLCKESNDIFCKWSVPFFRAVREGSIKDHEFQGAAQMYAQFYGRERFGEIWDTYLESKRKKEAAVR